MPNPMVDYSPWLWLAASAFALLLLLRGLRWALVSAQPDEWLLRVRNGRLVDAGIGIRILRLPGDVLARFSSTTQRVKFAATAYTREHVAVFTEGFALWTIAPDGEGPFVAFRRLGIANLQGAPRVLRSEKHLLTSPQYHAFQTLMVTELQKQIGATQLAQVLADPGALAARLDQGLRTLCDSLGIVLAQVELAQVELAQPRPVDAGALEDLAAESEEAVRAEGVRARAETNERLAHLEIESETRTAQQRARARLERETAEAKATLASEKQQATLFEAQAGLAQEKLAVERDLGLARAEAQHQVRLREAALAREAQLAEAETALEVARAQLARDEVLLAASLDKTRREAAAQRDAMLEVNVAEERKSQAVRDHELARAVTAEMGNAMSKFREPKWISIGEGSPLGAMATAVTGAVEGVRAVLVPGGRNARA
jgi:hypothetical protein